MPTPKGYNPGAAEDTGLIVHEILHEWVERMVVKYRLADLATLEIGSYDVNGSVRDLFSGHYWGVDLRAGPGVDAVIDGEHLPYNGTWPLVISTDTLEHVKRPWLFVDGMARAVGMGGWVILTTCDYGFPYHEFPGDYWRFSPEGIDLLLADAGLTVVERGGTPGITLFRLARKL